MSPRLNPASGMDGGGEGGGDGGGGEGGALQVRQSTATSLLPSFSLV